MFNEDKYRKINSAKFIYSKQNGFTLVEILIVVGVLAILAAGIIPNVGKFTANANAAAANSEVQTVRTAVLAYHGSTSEWPSDTAAAGFTEYISGDLRATYVFSGEGEITNADTSAVDNPWPTNLEFDPDSQLWASVSVVSPTPTPPATTAPATKTIAPTLTAVPKTTAGPVKPTNTPTKKPPHPVQPIK